MRRYANEETYVNPRIAYKLQELGFDWVCNKVYYNDCPGDNEMKASLLVDNEDENLKNGRNGDIECLFAPTLELAEKWLRDTKDYHICVSFLFANNRKYYVYISYPSYKGPLECNGGWIEQEFESYETALERGVEECLDILIKENAKNNL